MTNSRNTKGALLSSVIALCLCFTMLLGTTFAWFTDSVTSSGNIIKSGTLNVEMHWAKGNEDPTATTWFDASAGAIFDNDKWEPGYTEVRHIRIANEGTLALKYQLNIVADGEVSELADVIDVYYLDPAQKIASRDDLTDSQKIGTLSEVLANITKTASGNLLEGENHTVTLALKMREEAGNLYQNKSIGTSFSIQLVATQYTAEFDSLGNTYDEDAWVQGMIVHTPEQFKAALTTGGHIVLGSDIELTESITVPKSASTFSLRSAAPATVLNMNGFTVKGSMAKDAQTSNTGLIINEGNLIIYGDSESLFENTTANGASLIYNTGNLVINGGNYVGAPRVDGGYPQYVVRNNFGGSVTVKGGANITASWGAFSNYNGSTLSVEDATIYHDTDIAGTTYYLMCAGSGATINILDGNFTFNKPDANAMGAPILGVWDEGSKINIYGGTFDAEQGALNYASANIEIFGGTFCNSAKKVFQSTSGISVFAAENHTVVENADGSFSVIVTKTNVKDIIGDALNEAVANGETEVVVDLHNADIGGFDYGINTELVPAGTTVTIQNAVVSESSYGNAVDGTVVFENCVFDNKNGPYSIHFDAGSGDVVFRNCTLTGWCSFGSAIQSVTLEGCTIKHNGTYGTLRFYQDATLENCVIESTVGVDAYAGNLVLNNCSVDNGAYIASVVFADECFETITIDGQLVAHTQETFEAQAAAGATVYLIKNDTGVIYDLAGNQHDGLNVIALEDGVEVVNNTDYASSGRIGAIWQAIHLENVTLTNTVYTMADGGNATFKNVNFAAGVRRAYGKNVQFTDCTFGSNSEGYALHFESDAASEGCTIVLNGCTFEGGKVHLGSKRTYAFTGCDFAAGTDLQVWGNIILSGCTVDGAEVTSANVATLFPNLNLAKVTIQ